MTFGDIWLGPNSKAGEVFAIFSSLALIILIAFFWAAMFRKQRKRRHLYRHPHARSESKASAETSEKHETHSTFQSFRRRRHRRRRRMERPLNPTLAQVGGLPPPRDEDQPPAF